MIWGRVVTLVNVRGLETVRFTARILAIGEPPHRGDMVIDADGAFVLPGLINAHDHLELNHYGRLKFRDRYDNAAQWIDDMRPRLDDDPAIRAARQLPLTERLFAGALKNLLAGATTVAHHNPYYSELRRTLPIRVVRRYGWAHSFALEGRPAGARGEAGGSVQQRWRRTAADVPFLVHLAEGVDKEARRELARLDALGCLGPNTILVHGVAIDAAGLRKAAAAGAGLVWCPASNVFLFGRTASVRLFMDANRSRPAHIALGSDSRLTGSADLLDELRVARATGCASGEELLAMVTTNPARMLRLQHAGRLAVGSPADLIVVPPAGPTVAETLLDTPRRALALVAVGGRPLVGDWKFAPAFRARGGSVRSLILDGTAKLIDSGLARRIAGCPIQEPGVKVG
jgi:cytosine/adenosine deaminase-related metal-dependent hydrolase